MMANQRFQTVYIVCGAVEHKAFSVHYRIHVAIKATLIAVEPFYILQFGVFVKLVEETIAEASGGENCDCENDIHPFRDCRPDSTVDKVINPM